MMIQLKPPRPRNEIQNGLHRKDPNLMETQKNGKNRSRAPKPLWAKHVTKL